MKLSQQRILEIIPGAAMWLALLLPIILSSIVPAAVAIFILLFDLYWLYKAVIMGVHLVAGFHRLNREIAIDWRSRCGRAGEDIYHCVILTTYREPLAVIEQSVKSIVAADYPAHRLVVVLATESREGAAAAAKARAIKKKFGRPLKNFIITVHPDDIAGERKAKGPNATWAARQLTLWARRNRIPADKIIVTAADADTRFHPRYFAAVTYQYLHSPNRGHRTFQPIPIYANNIWQAPAVSRILAFGSSFWQLIESTRPWRLINFSTHAMSLKTLEEMNYWDVTVINEDSRQFWRAYFKFNGDHVVEPIFIPVYLDAVLTDSYLGTLKNQYQQRLRWAYGIEHFPYVFEHTFKRSPIPLLDRLVKLYRLFEANFSWATASIFLAFVGWLPLILNQNFSHTVLGHNIPIYATRILSLTWIGMVISALISLQLLPPRPAHMKKMHSAGMLLQWLLAPISAIIFGSIPAIDAQTRLMLGRPFGFWVTEKRVVGS